MKWKKREFLFFILMKIVLMIFFVSLGGDLLILVVMICCGFLVIILKLFGFVEFLILILIIMMFWLFRFVIVVFIVFMLFIDWLFIIIMRKCLVFGCIFCDWYIFLVFFRVEIRFMGLCCFLSLVIICIKDVLFGLLLLKIIGVVIMELKIIML